MTPSDTPPARERRRSLSIVLYRVDERLIHGQVVIGWGHHLRPDCYIIVDDELATSDWEQELYALGAGEADVDFVGVEAARKKLVEWKDDDRRAILLTRDVSTMLALSKGGRLGGEEVNLGGMHSGPDRVEVLPYLHLGAGDRNALEAMADDGVAVTARDLPETPRVNLVTILGR